MASRTLKGLIAGLGVAALALGAVDQASAITFNWTQRSGWVLGTETSAGTNGGIQFYNPVGTIGTSTPPASTYEVLAWGCQVGSSTNCAPSGATQDTDDGVITDPRLSSRRSALEIQFGGFTGTIQDDGIPVDITRLLHYNRGIDANSVYLTGARVDSILRFTDADPPFADANPIPVGFDETLNVTPCGPDQISSTPCDDIFLFDPTGFAPVQFTSSGITYEITFGIRSDDPDVLLIDLLTGKVITREGDLNDLFITMSLRRVPAPQSLVLLGLGLLGIGLADWRRRSKQA